MKLDSIDSGMEDMREDDPILSQVGSAASTKTITQQLATRNSFKALSDSDDNYEAI